METTTNNTLAPRIMPRTVIQFAHTSINTQLKFRMENTVLTDHPNAKKGKEKEKKKAQHFTIKFLFFLLYPTFAAYKYPALSPLIPHPPHLSIVFLFPRL